MQDITVIILTKNEEIHIRRCIESVQQIAKQIIVVDSESTDKTISIARDLGAEVYTHTWPGNQAAQFNWALDNVNIRGNWIFRLDADEYVPPTLRDEIMSVIPNVAVDVSGILIPRINLWMQKVLKHGSSNVILLRIFKKGFGKSEVRLMDEHIKIHSGETITLSNYFVDDNLHNLSWWSNKHIDYAIREAAELLDSEFNLSESLRSENILDPVTTRNRKNKSTYVKLPLFWRSFAYFLYRYFFKGGFLDGKEGFLRHFLQGWWYRTLVDAKIFEIKQKSGGDPQMIKEILKSEYNIIF